MRKLGRRAFISSAFALVGLGAFGVDATFGAIEALDPAIVKSELRVKTELEGAFVDDVIEKAKKGELPVKILHAAFRYARDKNRTQRMVYFKKGLETLTKRAGLKIAFLDF